MTEPPRKRAIQLTPASAITPEPVVWAWEDNGDGRIPAGALTVAAGREGTGKSSFGIWLASQVTRGVLPGSFYGRPNTVIYVAVEDSWKYTLVPRLMAAGAVLDHVYRAEVTVDETEHSTLCLPTDLGLLEDAITSQDVALVVLDPLMSVINAGIDTHRERDTRTALDPLARLADRTRCMVLGIAHFSKGASTDASALITGSGAFKNVPRAVFGFAVDPEDGTSVLTQTKNSLGKSDLPSLAYQVREAKVETPKGIASVGKFVFTGESDRSVRDILAANGGDDADEREDAAAWLAAHLADNGGEAEVIDILKAGDKVGFSKDTLKRAKKKAGAVSRKEAMDAGWMWVAKGAKSAKGAKGGDGREDRSLPLPSADDPVSDLDEGSAREHLLQDSLSSLPSRSSLPSERISRRVQVGKGGIIPPGAVYVGRAAPRVRLFSSPYGNPHPVGRPGPDGHKPCKVPRCNGAVHDRAEAIEAFREDLRAAPDLVDAIRRDFADGQAAACWCPADLACHADLIIAIAEGEEP